MNTPVTAYCATCGCLVKAEMKPDSTGHEFVTVEPCVPCTQEVVRTALDTMDAIDKHFGRTPEEKP